MNLIAFNPGKPGKWRPQKLLLVMKITIALILFFVISASANTFAQRISLAERNAPLVEVLEKIRLQSGYDFVASTRLIEKSNRVSIHVNEVSLEEALKICFSNQKLTYKIQGKIVLIKEIKNTVNSLVSNAREEITVKGNVADKTGPLPGVTVSLKSDKQKAVLTDASGSFKITVPKDGVLIFSSIGFKTLEVPINGRAVLDVFLEQETSGLSEVVVTGYGQKQTKVSLTGAISSISTKELKQSPVANISNALAGRIPGLVTAQRSGRPGSDASSLFIRGISTYTGNTAPLVVIDGLPRGDQNFGDIDPNEIESISILKDASSTSLYGIQGANGVILVTTKRGEDGSPTIQVNAQNALMKPGRFPKFLDSYQSGLLRNEAARNDGIAPVYTDRELQLFKDQTSPYLYPDVDWYKEMIRDYTPQRQVNLNVNGGTKAVKYFVSGSYLRQETNFKVADENIYGVKYKYDRYNFRSNIDVTLDKNTDLQLDLASRLENRTMPHADRNDNGYLFVVLSQMHNALTPVFNPDGSLASGNLRADFINPYGIITRNGYSDTNFSNTFGNVAATRKLDFITPGLKIKSLFSFETFGSIDFAQYQMPASFRYKGEDEITGKPIYVQHYAKTSLSQDGATNATRYNYFDVKLLYDRSFKNHNVSGLMLFNRNYRTITGDLPRVYQGLVGQLKYNYDQRYFFEFNAGYNGSENFPKGKRYGFFPAVSAGWLASAEPFMKDNKVFSYLKLRGSHGLVGNDNIGDGRYLFVSEFARSGGYTFGNNPTGVGGYSESRVGNTNITWEKATKSNIGLEAGFLKDQIRLTVDIFREHRKDILTGPNLIPDYFGIDAALSLNKGAVLNRGFEIEMKLNTNIGDVYLFSNLNYTFTKNKILEIDEPKLQYPWQTQIGLPVGYSLGYESLGFFQNQTEINNSPIQSFTTVIPGDLKYRDISGNGSIGPEDRIPIPTLNVPNQVFGASFGLSYKGVDLSVLLQGAMGGRQIYSDQIVYTYRDGIRPHHLERWTPENPVNAKFPVLHGNESKNGNNFINSTFWVRKTDYLKIKNLELGYRLPSTWTRKVGTKTARVFVNAMNLYSWDHLKDINVDPESNVGGSFSGLSYPIQSIYNLGLTVNF